MFGRKNKPKTKSHVLDLRKKPKEKANAKNPPIIPADTQARRIIASGLQSLKEVPPGLRCHEMDLSDTGIESLPDDLVVSNRLDLTDCTALEQLPAGIETGSLILRNCTALKSLPPNLNVSFLDVQGCRLLREIPSDLTIRAGRLNLRDCPLITEIPATIGPLAQLDLAGCVGIQSLPDELVVRSWIDLAGTGITALPASMQGIQIRWRSVLIDERIAFRPQEITADEILNEPNAEVRRVKMERLGFEKFMHDAKAEELDADTDPGGPRRLLRVPMEDDEDLVCVSVICPSTDRHYLIRVPPKTRTCRQAVAWTAGFDNPDDYNPVIET